jgi:predicted TIM-barrel fold metal-dependent hydrolase
MNSARTTFRPTIAPTSLQVQSQVGFTSRRRSTTNSTRGRDCVGGIARRGIERSRLDGPIGLRRLRRFTGSERRRGLSRHCAYPLARGVRQEAWFDPVSTRADIPREDLLSDPAWQEGYRRLADFGLSFDLLVWPDQLPQAATIAADTPAVPVVLDHLGLPDPITDTGLRIWRTGTATLAQLPHACVKLSAFSWLGNPRDERAVRSVVSELLELFGPQRCMVGSNFPVERLAGDFGSLYDLVLACLQDLSEEQRAEVLFGTALRFYRISRPASADDRK